MRGRVVKSLYKKEMLDVLRDKKTVLMMLVVPLVMYPLLFIFGMQLMVKVTAGMAEHTYRVAVADEERDLFDSLLASAEKDGNRFSVVETSDPEAALLREAIDAYVTTEEKDGRKTYRIHYVSAVTNSGYATDLLIQVLRQYSAVLTVERIEEAGLDPMYILEPVGIETYDNASKEATAGSLLGMILPFMLIVSLLLGTMYPAIDTTAGERERGTLETVLTLPISNHELIFSKFLTVATIGIVSAFLNVLAMCGVGVYMYKMVEQVNEQTAKLHMGRFVPAILIGVLCVFAFAVFISAISMCFCAFAKSYKEANNYITPLMLVVTFASFINLMPNVVLTNRMALVPVVNICLLIRDLLAFKMNFYVIAIVLFSNVLYGVLTIWFLGRIYSSEAILFGDGSTNVQIFERRSNMKRGGVPTLGDVWLVLAVTAVAILYIGGSVVLKSALGSVLCTQLLLLFLPVCAVLYSKKDFVKTFRLRVPSWRAVIGGMCMIFGAVCIGVLLTAATSLLFPSSAEALGNSTISLDTGGFFGTLLLVAVLPAVCEELLFRGFVFSAFEAKLSVLHAVWLSAAIFGVYHMNLVQFFTTAFLGAVIGYVAHRSKSIFPGMLMHAANNGLAVIAAFYPRQAERIFPLLAKTTVSVSDVCLLAASGIALLGIGAVVIKKISVE